MARDACCCAAASRSTPRAPDRSRRPLRLAGSLASATALALLPKCPMCLVAYLSALGLGTGAASLAGALYPIAGLAAAALVGVLGVRLVRETRRSRRVLPALAVGAALAGVAIAFVTGAPGAVRLAALAGLALALVWADRGAAALTHAGPAAHRAVV